MRLLVFLLALIFPPFLHDRETAVASVEAALTEYAHLYQP